MSSIKKSIIEISGIKMSCMKMFDIDYTILDW